MAYVNRRRGIRGVGDTQYQGPCADPSQTMDPTTGQCVSSSDLLQQIINTISQSPGGAIVPSPMPWLPIALFALAGVVVIGALKK